MSCFSFRYKTNPNPVDFSVVPPFWQWPCSSGPKVVCLGGLILPMCRLNVIPQYPACPIVSSSSCQDECWFGLFDWLFLHNPFGAGLISWLDILTSWHLDIGESGRIVCCSCGACRGKARLVAYQAWLSCLKYSLTHNVILGAHAPVVPALVVEGYVCDHVAFVFHCTISGAKAGYLRFSEFIALCFPFFMVMDGPWGRCLRSLWDLRV